MRRTFSTALILAVGLFAGCSTTPPGPEDAPKGTVSYLIRIESSEPGVSIETNSVYAGKTPLTLKVFGNPDGTFHHFEGSQYVVRAVPMNASQFPQEQIFSAGSKSSPGARIPDLLFFDMTRKSGNMTLEGIPEN